MNLKESLMFLKNYYFKVLNNQVYSITMFIFLILGILYPRLLEYSNLVPSFALYIYGGTGTRKTTTTMCMLNPFELQTASFEDSLASIVEQFRNMGLGCFIIDDMKRIDKDSLNVINRIIRLVGDATTQGFKMRGNNVIKQNISCLCAITGENVLNLQESSIARLLMFEYQKDTVNLEKLTEIANKKEKLLTSILTVIQCTLCNDNFIEELCEQVTRNRNTLQSENSHGRYIDMLSWLITMYRILMLYFKKENVEFVFDYEDGIKALVKTQELKYKTDPTTVFADLLFDMAEKNMLTICKEDDFLSGKYIDVIDYQEEWFIASNRVFSKVANYAESIDQNINFSEKALRSELLAKNVLKPYNGKNTRELRKHSNRCCGFYIRKNELKKYRREIGGM